MAKLTNKDFVYLTKEQSPRLRAIAKKRMERDADGTLSMDDLKQIIKVCAFSGDRTATKWLKNLQSIVVTGAFMEAKDPKNFGEDSGTHVFMTHVLDVHRRCQRGELPFDINERVLIKESGKHGMIADYNDTSGLYIIVLDPFQVAEFDKKALTKVASKKVADDKEYTDKEKESLKRLKEQQKVWEKQEKPADLKDVKDEELDDALKGLGTVAPQAKGVDTKDMSTLKNLKKDQIRKYKEENKEIPKEIKDVSQTEIDEAVDRLGK